MDRAEHYSRAEALLDEGEEIVKRISEAEMRNDDLQANELGKKAMGIWAQAQVHATLASVDVGLHQ